MSVNKSGTKNRGSLKFGWRRTMHFVYLHCESHIWVKVIDELLPFRRAKGYDACTAF